MFPHLDTRPSILSVPEWSVLRGQGGTNHCIFVTRRMLLLKKPSVLFVEFKSPTLLKYFFFQFDCDLHHTLVHYSPDQKFFILTLVPNVPSATYSYNYSF